MAYFLRKIRAGIMQHDRRQSFAEFTLKGLYEHPQSAIFCVTENSVLQLSNIILFRIMLHFPLHLFDHCLVVG